MPTNLPTIRAWGDARKVIWCIALGFEFRDLEVSEKFFGVLLRDPKWLIDNLCKVLCMRLCVCGLLYMVIKLSSSSSSSSSNINSFIIIIIIITLRAEADAAEGRRAGREEAPSERRLQRGNLYLSLSLSIYIYIYYCCLFIRLFVYYVYASLSLYIYIYVYIRARKRYGHHNQSMYNKNIII